MYSIMLIIVIILDAISLYLTLLAMTFYDTLIQFLIMWHLFCVYNVCYLIVYMTAREILILDKTAKGECSDEPVQTGGLVQTYQSYCKKYGSRKRHTPKFGPLTS